MKTTYTIAAIAMFAVILGMSALAPAMAKGPQPHVSVDVCHFDRDVNDDGIVEDPPSEDRAWEVLSPNTHGAENGHMKHGDTEVDDTDDPKDDTITTSVCLEKADPDLPA